MDVYINNGNASTWTIGDGVRLADIDGKPRILKHSHVWWSTWQVLSILIGDGIDDYVQIDAQGRLTAYKNGGPSSTSNVPWVWYSEDNGNLIATGVGVPGSAIRLADLNGDGKADYVIVDPETGSITWYENGGEQVDGSWIWYPRGKVADGIGNGAGVVLADIVSVYDLYY